MDYNLEQRTVDFGKRVALLCRQVEQKKITEPLANQLIRSATSVGANYFEANGASSKKDFKNKIHICKKEAKETCYWLAIIEEFCNLKEEVKSLQKEAHELLLIFSKIAANSK